MSTAKKKTIKFTALMTVLILTVTYFSLLTPTSAYFYKEVSDGGHIKFSLFQVNNGDEDILSEIADIKFKGATKFADFDEKLFDEVAEIRTYTVTNTGDVPARVMTRITPLDGSDEKGLKYMIVVSDPYGGEASTTETTTTETTTAETTTTETTTTETAILPKGEIKEEIESRLELFTNATAVSYATAIDALNVHNAIEKNTRTLKTGESVDVKIYFWAEYDEVMSAAGGEEIWQDAESVTSVGYTCKIEMIASQDKDEAVVEALETTTENQ